MQRVIYLRRPLSRRDQAGLQQQLERAFQSQWSRPGTLLMVSRRHEIWQPPTDVYETAEAFVVRVELAGMREAEVSITLDEHSLRIEGQRPDLEATGVEQVADLLIGEVDLAVHDVDFSPLVGVLPSAEGLAVKQRREVRGERGQGGEGEGNECAFHRLENGVEERIKDSPHSRASPRGRLSRLQRRRR